MYNYDHCNAEQKQILDTTPCFFLTKKEHVNFHFMMHMRSTLRSPDFMEAYETDLLESKYDQIWRNCPNIRDIDYRNTFIPLKEYDFENTSAEKFQDIINDVNQTPLVAKGLIKDSKAVKHWTHEYLRNNYKDVQIVASNESSGGSDIKKLSLREIVESQLDKDFSNSYYINNSAELFNDYPELIDDIGADRILKLFQNHSVNSFSQMFVGNLRTWGTNWHMGNDTSCALMINGTKRWYFIDPRLAYILKPILDGANGMLTKMDARQDLFFHRIHSPLYAIAPKFYVDLEPGDVLFFTKYWPHAVINLTPLQIMGNMRMTEVDLDSMTKGKETPNLLPLYDSIINSDPEFIKFKFDIYKNLGKKEKLIGDDNYFSAYATVNQSLSKEAVR